VLHRSGFATLAVLASAVLATLLPVPGLAAPGVAVAAAQPWATVNVCDTVGHPDGVGIRGSMPGTGTRRDELFMRLQVQFRRANGTWAGIGRAGDSGFLDLGRGDVRARQSGRTFTLVPPVVGRPAYVLRGLVTFDWRRNGTVVRRVRRLTAAGHPGTPGADPAGFSAATCSIR
jgi:hypothetical protein